MLQAVFDNDANISNCNILPKILVALSRRDTLSRFSDIYKGDNFCDFLFAFLHTKVLLKTSLF